MTLPTWLQEGLGASTVAEPLVQGFTLVRIRDNLLALVALGTLLAGNTVLPFGAHATAPTGLACVGTHPWPAGHLPWIAERVWLRQLYVRLFGLQSFIPGVERVGD